jgi:hypothetical protein
MSAMKRSHDVSGRHVLSIQDSSSIGFQVYPLNRKIHIQKTPLHSLLGSWRGWVDGKV